MIEDEIAALEAELRAAQLASDADALDRLIAEDLLFAGPDGQLATKADDLAAHRTRALRFTSHEPQDVRMRRVGDDVVIVSLLTRIAGSVHGQPFGGSARYTRVWAREGDRRWRIVAGQESSVPEPG